MQTLCRYFRKFNTVGKIGLTNAANIALNIIENKFSKAQLLSRPVILDIVPTKLCNLNCIFCIQYSTEEEKHLSLENFHYIAKRFFPYAYQVYFCSGGEPFLNKDFLNFLDICKDYRTFITITSNGVLLTEKICQELVKNKYLKAFSFSFDGFKKETVESIRRGIDFQRVIENMRLMAALKSKYKRGTPLLNIRYVAMKRNIEELPDLIRYARRIGLDRVSVNYLNVTKNMDKNESLFYHPELANRIFKESLKIAKKEKIQLELPPSLAKQSKKDQCPFPWKFIKIDPDGSVRFCYKAWDNPVGNIFETENLFELWNSIRYQKIRRSVNSDNPYFKYCSVCEARRGLSEEASHIQYLKEELYKFDE